MGSRAPEGLGVPPPERGGLLGQRVAGLLDGLADLLGRQRLLGGDVDLPVGRSTWTSQTPSRALTSAVTERTQWSQVMPTT